jgi:hypothetical protein
MKCRLTVHLSEGVNASLIKAAERPGRTKSSIVELALEQFLNGATATAHADQSLLRRLDHMSVKMNQMARDGQISLETLALFVRYYLTITPPLPAVDQEAARALGRERFQTFVTQIGRRLATGSRMIAEVMENLPDLKPDLFSTDVTAPTPAAVSSPEDSHSGNGPRDTNGRANDPGTDQPGHPGNGSASVGPIDHPAADGATDPGAPSNDALTNGADDAGAGCAGAAHGDTGPGNF